MHMSLLPAPTKEQEECLSFWREGKSQVCRACAGAGKTTLLLHAASSREGTYILTYNRSLCNSVQQMLDAMEIQSRCFTFHGLASHVFENVCYDDSVLESEVEKAEKAEKAEEEWSRPACPPSVCVDEAQDLRPIHVRLLKLLFPTVPVWIVVGDERQLLYTFMDPPADVSYMRDPPFGPEGLEWERTNMTLSHRLTKQNCDLANHLLLSDELSSQLPPLRQKEGTVGPLPLLLTCSPYSWGETVHSLLKEEEDPSSVLLLVRSTKATQSVSDMVNHLSSKGIPIYVHGQEGGVPKCSHGKMVVCTMHAAKGLQAETVIVAGVSSETEGNPLHVAVTRAKRRLVLLQEARRPREDLMEAYRSGIVEGDKKTEERSKKPCTVPQMHYSSPRFKDLTYWSPSKVFTIQRDVLFDPAESTSTSTELTIHRGEKVEDVTDILLTSILFYLETKESPGKPPQRVRDMLYPTVCSTYEERTRMLLSGDRTRTVLRGRSHLLPERGWSSLRSADCSTPKGCVTASVIAHAFNGFHNRIYSLLPVEEWLDESLFLRMAKKASSLELEGALFDALVVLSSECVCRVPILTKEEECVFLTCESSTAGARECLPACVLEGSGSMIVNVKTGLIERCSAGEEEKESLLRLACSSS